MNVILLYGEGNPGAQGHLGHLRSQSLDEDQLR